MKRLLGLACWAVLAGGCANGPTRPEAGPGSGVGSEYVPMVAASSAPAASYDALVAKCQSWARGLPLHKTTNYDDGLAFIFVASVGAVAATPAGMGVSGVALVATTAGANLGLREWTYSPQREVWHQQQETQIANCMTQAGYANVDPTVRVTWVQRPPVDTTTRLIGRDTYYAERLAKQSSCGIAPVATLIDKGPGFENHRVACANGRTLAVRCEFGNCRLVADRAAMLDQFSARVPGSS